MSQSATQFDLWWRELNTKLFLAPLNQEEAAWIYQFHVPRIEASTSEATGWIPSFAGAAPSERYWHTAIWTGSEMIIWGGFNDDYMAGSHGHLGFNNGSRYNPATDSWITIAPAPHSVPPRFLHAAVWTGREMIIWGGWDYRFATYSTGARYDPTTDRWTPTSRGGKCPSSRIAPAVWTGTEMIIWGGIHINYYWDLRYENDGARYTPETDSWTAMTMVNAPMGRGYHTAVWTGQEMIVWGGSSINQYYENTGGRYDPIVDAWTATSIGPNCPKGRIWHTAIWTGQEMIIWGADFRSNISGGRYNPSNDTWAPVDAGANSPPQRTGHSAVWTGTEMIIWGGEIPKNYMLGGHYDPIQNTWRPVSDGSNRPTARWYHSAIWTGEEMIIWGGYEGRYGPGLNSGGRYSPASDSWVPTSLGIDVAGTRCYHTATWTGMEMIIWGGSSDEYPHLWGQNSGARYDIALDAWLPTSLEDAPIERITHTAIWTGTEMIIWGGKDNHDQSLNSGGRYQPSDDSWLSTTIIDQCPSARSGHTAVWTGRRMIVWGPGQTGAQYDPLMDSWSPTSTGDNCPSTRSNHSAVWTGKQMCVWGGIDDYGAWGDPIETNTGGLYDPLTDSWTTTSTSGACPSPRCDHSAICADREMIIWGGQNRWAGGMLSGTTAQNDGAQYEPLAGKWRSLPTPPEELMGAIKGTTIWTGRELIIWGGLWFTGLTNSSPNDAVRTGGRIKPNYSGWMPIYPSAYCPSGRYGHSAVWTGKEMIIWGGVGGLSSGGIYRPGPHERPVEKP